MLLTLRLLRVLALSKYFEIHQMDIKTAFLGQDQSSDERSMYMELPPGISRGPRRKWSFKFTRLCMA
jgi:hypothetical protein